MNARIVFFPASSQWYVTVYAGLKTHWFKKNTLEWQDCLEPVEVEKSHYSDDPMDSIEIYKDIEYRRVMFPSYEKALEWLNQKGLTLCDDHGYPIVSNSSDPLRISFGNA